MSAGEVRENYDAIQESMRRGFAVGDPARRSRDGNGKIAAPVGPVTGQRDFAQQNGGRIKPDERRGFDGGAPARRSRDGDGKIPARVGPVTVRGVSRS